jgi:DNA polymerase-3 subunit alpha
MGKKKVEKIPAQLEKFISGSKEKGIPTEKAQKIFDLMKSFAEYGFNKSHSAAYAYITYQTAFLKRYFTPEYMAALLTTEMGDIDKVGEYIKDTREHGIEVLPPDINESTRVFNVPLEEMDVNPRIRFGFGAIKGVGDAAIEAIIEERNENGAFTDFVDFCCRVNLKKVNKKTVESLLKAGCFDNIEKHNRATLISSMEPVMEYASRRKEDKERGQESLFGAIDGGDSMGPSMNVEEAFPESIKLEMEKELVGFYISGHPLDPFEKILPKFRTMSCKQASQVKASDFGGAVDPNMPFRRPKKSVALTGMISSYRTHINKAGKKMAFLKIEDLTGEIEGVIFANVFEKVEGSLGGKDPVVINADLELKGDKAQVIVQNIGSLKQESRKKFNLVKINVPLMKFSPEKLSDLKSLLLKHRGACRISLTFTDHKGGNVQMGLPEAYSVSPTASLAEEINQLIGNPSVEFLATRSKKENQLS